MTLRLLSRGNSASKVVAIFPIGLLLFSLFSFSAPHNVYAQTSGIKTYTIAEYGVVLQYPEDWTVEQLSTTEIYFSPPSSNNAGNVSAMFTVSDATDVESIEDLTDQLVAFYESIFPDVEIYESVPTMFGEYNGERLVFYATQDDVKMKIGQAYAMNDGKIYFITYRAPPNDYLTYWPAISDMIRSFKIDTSIIPVEVSGGMYSNEELGLKIDFPEGWNGLQIKNENGTSVALVPADGRKLSMVLVAVKASEFAKGGSQDPLSGCNNTSVRFDEINDMSSILFEGECDRAEGFFVMKAYMFAFDEKIVIAMLVAPSRTAYDSGADQFDEAVQTLSLKNSVNAFSALMYSYGKNLKEVGVEYANTEAGISMRLPDGWNGFEEVRGESTSLTMLPPLTEKEAAIITIDVIDKSSYKSEYEVEFAGDIQYVVLNGISALSADGEFEVQDIKLRSKGYILTTEDKILSIAYSAPTQEGYSSYKSEFEQSLQTLAIEDNVDVTTYLPLSVDFNKSERSVNVDNKPYGVKVASTSDVTDIVLNQEERQVSLTLEGKSIGNGTSFITVSSVLEGPYIVTIDGASADFNVLNGTGSDQNTIVVNHPRDAESIVIAGTRVVPELPFAIFNSIAVIVGLVIVMTRAKRFLLPSGQ